MNAQTWKGKITPIMAEALDQAREFGRLVKYDGTCRWARPFNRSEPSGVGRGRLPASSCGQETISRLVKLGLLEYCKWEGEKPIACRLPDASEKRLGRIESMRANVIHFMRSGGSREEWIAAWDYVESGGLPTRAEEVLRDAKTPSKL